MLPSFPFQSLLHWYQKNGRRNLPWRHFEGCGEQDRAYRVWLSEILLQQTQAPRVVPFFERILSVFPDIHTLANASYEAFFPYYDGLGYYSRARNLLKTATIVSHQFQGVFPKDSTELQKLPGIGEYTAEAIRAFAFNIPTLSFDTNLEKVLSRYYFWNRFQKLTRDEKEGILEQFKQSGLQAADINAAFMDYANIVSLWAKSKVDFRSQVLPGCRFFETFGELEPDKKPERTTFPLRDAKIVVLLSDGLGKKLFSATKSWFEPFILDASPEVNHRLAVKTFFLSQYGLSVSVRPAFEKALVNDAPFAFYRARIQTGNPHFPVFPLESGKEFLQSFLKS